MTANIKRLQILRDHIATKQEAEVDLNYMCEEDDRSPCGTLACGMGWAAHDNLFTELGIPHPGAMLQVNGKVMGCYVAAMVVFNLDANSDAMALFGPGVSWLDPDLEPIEEEDNTYLRGVTERERLLYRLDKFIEEQRCRGA